MTKNRKLCFSKLRVQTPCFQTLQRTKEASSSSLGIKVKPHELFVACRNPHKSIKTQRILSFLRETHCHVPKSVVCSVLTHYSEKALHMSLHNGFVWNARRRKSMCETIAFKAQLLYISLNYFFFLFSSAYYYFLLSTCESNCRSAPRFTWRVVSLNNICYATLEISEPRRAPSSHLQHDSLKRTRIFSSKSNRLIV